MLAVDSSKTFFRTCLVGRQHCADTTDFKPNKQDLRSELLSGLQDAKVTIPLNSFMFRTQILIGQSLSEPLKQQRTKNTFWGRCGLCVMSQNHGQFWHKLNTNGLDKSKIQYLKKYKPQVFVIFSILVSAISDVVVNCSSVLGLAKCLYHLVCSMQSMFQTSLFCAINFSDLVLSLKFSILYGVRFIQGFSFNQFIDQR